MVMIEKNALYSSYKTLNDIHINNKPKLQQEMTKSQLELQN